MTRRAAKWPFLGAIVIGAGLLAQGAAAQESVAPVKTIEGAEPGVRAEILSLARSEGGLLTLRVAFVNDSGGEVRNKALPGSGNVEKFELIDYMNKRKYPVIMGSDGHCFCTSLNPFGSFGPGRKVFWAKFPAPPASVTRISVLLPEGEPIDGVPITN